jgi:hypothetical protein
MTTRLPHGPETPAPPHPGTEPYAQPSGHSPSSLTASGFAPSVSAPSGLPAPGGYPQPWLPPGVTTPDAMPSGLAGVPIAPHSPAPSVPGPAQAPVAGPSYLATQPRHAPAAYHPPQAYAPAQPTAAPPPAYPVNQPHGAPQGPGAPQGYGAPHGYWDEQAGDGGPWLVSGGSATAVARSEAPAVWPVVLFTLLMIIPGAVSAQRRARQAEEAGRSVRPYYLAFGLVAVVSFLIGLIPTSFVYVEVRESALTKLVQSNIVSDGKLRASTGLTVTKAKCAPTAARAENGRRPYVCEVNVSDGRYGTLNVVADGDGNWTLAPVA